MAATLGDTHVEVVEMRVRLARSLVDRKQVRSTIYSVVVVVVVSFVVLFSLSFAKDGASNGVGRRGADVAGNGAGSNTSQDRRVWHRARRLSSSTGTNSLQFSVACFLTNTSLAGSTERGVGAGDERDDAARAPARIERHRRWRRARNKQKTQVSSRVKQLTRVVYRFVAQVCLCEIHLERKQSALARRAADAARATFVGAGFEPTHPKLEQLNALGARIEK